MMVVMMVMVKLISLDQGRVIFKAQDTNVTKVVYRTGSSAQLHFTCSFMQDGFQLRIT